MIPTRCLALAAVFWAIAPAAAQPPPPAAVAPAASDPFAGDARAADLSERYKAMLAANPVAGIALDRLWKTYVDHGATAALTAEFRQSAALHGGVENWLIYGHLLEKAGEFAPAGAAYAQAAQVDPANPLPALARGDLALVQHRPPEAAALFAEALAKLPANDRRRADVLLKLGNAWLAAGQPTKASETWEQLIAATPTNLALHKQLAETYAQNHLVDQALAHLDAIDRLADPAGRAAALREAGRLHEGRGEFDAAHAAFERGLALTSRDNWLHAELLGAIIRLYQRAGRAPELAAEWQRAAEENPRDLGGFLRLETLAEAQSDVRAEVTWLDRITALAPRDRDSRLKLARLLATGEDPARAAALYDQLLREQPDRLDLILARADLELQMGAPEAAVRRVEARLAQTAADETIAAPGLEFFLSRHLDEAAERCLRAAAERLPEALEPGVALAKFYFAHRRPEEGRRELDRLTKAPAGAAAPAERWARVASVYKEENLPAEALRCWQEAARLAPRDPAPLEAASELCLAQGDSAAAVAALRLAVAAAAAGPAREEIEHKLFQVLSAGPGGVGAPRAATGPGSVRHRLEVRGHLPAGLGPPPPETGTAIPGSPLDQYLGELETVASHDPSPATLLRLARWQMWAGRTHAAATTAEKVFAADPANLAARQLLIHLEMDAHQSALAARRLREIIGIDPAHRATYLRQLAGLQLEDGDFDAALRGYGELQAAQPGAFDPLNDLALAQQRAERWFDALATWKRAYALPALSPIQRAEVRKPLIAAYERLGEFPPAADLLAAAVEEEADLARKQEMFQDLREFCGKHGLLDWLQSRYETRLQAQPDDYFTQVAVAELWKSRGRDEEAYRLLGRAFYSAPDPVAAVKSLATAAESLGEDEEVVAERRRLVGMAGQDTAENLEKLATAQEDACDDQGAAQTWNQIAARFPRDVKSLAAVADFFERNEQPARARAVLGQIVAIEPADLPHLFHLAELDRDGGDRAGAGAGFEAVLARSRAEGPGDALQLPTELIAASEPASGSSGSARPYRPPPPAPSPLPGTPDGDERVLRLRSIRELASLLPARGSVGADGPRNLWAERWAQAAAAGARSEPLQALYASGNAPGTLDLLSRWMEEHPADERLPDAFLRAGLHLGEYARLGEWTWPEHEAALRVARGPQLVEALRQCITEGLKPGPKMVAELFPPWVRARDLLWRAAKEGFADRRWYAQAAEIGERVADATGSDRAVYAFDLAQWELFLDRPDRARAELRAAIDEGGGVCLENTAGNPIFQCLRAYYLLLRPEERPGFVEDYLRAWDTPAGRVHRVLSAVLLHGLAGDQPRVRVDLDALLALRLTDPDTGERSSATRRWTYLRNCGVQLEDWSLGSCAAYLWRKAVSEATAFDRRDLEIQGLLAEISGRLLLLEIGRAVDPQACRESITQYIEAHPPLDMLHSTASQLLASAEFPAARQFYEHLTRQEPGNGENWRNLLLACEATGDSDAVENILLSLLRDSAGLPPSLSRPELVRDAAVLRQVEGDAPGALRWLESELSAGDRSAQVITALASCYGRLGKFDDAARVWQEGIAADPGNARAYRVALARIEDQRGNLPAAIALLEDPAVSKPSPGDEGAPGLLVDLYQRSGQLDKARHLTLDLLQHNDQTSIGAAAEAFARAGQSPQFRAWLRTASRRAREPQAQYQLQLQLLQGAANAPATPEFNFEREMRRLRKIARSFPTLLPAYEKARYALARQHGADHWLEAELQRDWKDGRGDPTAGEQLATFYLDTAQPERLRAVVRTIDERPNLPEPFLAALEKRLPDAHLAEAALFISERLFRHFPQGQQYALSRARVLWKAGQTDEASRLLTALDCCSYFREDMATAIGNLCEELGDERQATSYYQQATQADPDGLRTGAAYLRLAQLESAHQHWRAARRLLQIAYRHPQIAADLNPLVDFLQSSGELTTTAPSLQPGSGFPLTDTKRAQLLLLIYQRWKKAGRLPAAQALVAAQPDCLAKSFLLTTAWCQDLRTDQLPAAIALLENPAHWHDARSIRLDRDLAALYLRWADGEANSAPLDPNLRLARLTRAQQLAPGNFEIARRLATLCREQHHPDRARAALQPFLGPGAVPAERNAARDLLALH